jgi:hypothetical protein
VRCVTMTTTGRHERYATASALLAALFLSASPAVADPAGSPPAIRATATNRVPSCVTPERLMAFLGAHNDQVAPRYATIAAAYRDLGEAWHIRWDYAFFQMVLETNYLKFRRGDGSSGDVGASQNNFAGIGATGGGVPGDRFPDVRTGVLAQMQHLTAYVGDPVERPVAQRTREYQKDIIEISRKLGRPVTFGDLARRWAADRGYAKNIETVADLFRKNHCTANTASDAKKQAFLPPPHKLGASAEVDAEALIAPKATPLVRTIWRRGDPIPPVPRRAEPTQASPVAPVALTTRDDALSSQAADDNQPTPEPSAVAPAPLAAIRPARVLPAPAPTEGAARFALAAQWAVATGAIAAAERCRVFSASYGGSQVVLISHSGNGETRLTALTVEERSGEPMAESFIATHAQGGVIIGRFESSADALDEARKLCPGG